ncbi:MAG: cupin domain-containing protein [Sphaerochaetaceae bacterium]
MIENVYTFSTEELTHVERIVQQENLRINHLSLAVGDAVDPHPTPEAAHMIVTSGTLALKLNDQEQKHYPAGSIIGIPANTMLHIANGGNKAMHLFVIKTE